MRITSALSHPNTVTVLDFGWTTSGVFYYVMEYLPGVDLEELVRRHGPQPDWRVVHLLRQACGALTEAHARGLLHRDVKPANLIVSERGGVPDVLHVVDFGLARLARAAQGPEFSGTPGYMAPEVILRRADIDERADLYSLGAVAYWLCTGTPVFDGVTPADVSIKHVAAEPAAPSTRTGRAVHPALEELVLACLAKRPADRPASAAELLAWLDDLAEETPFEPAAARRFWRDVAPSETGPRPEPLAPRAVSEAAPPRARGR